MYFDLHLMMYFKSNTGKLAHYLLVDGVSIHHGITDLEDELGSKCYTVVRS
jgi:hypothetical protein